MTRKCEPEVMQLGRRIRHERMRQGLSLKEVEKRAGISPTHISEIERGRSSPTVGALVRIARALDRPLAHLVAAPPRHGVVFGLHGARRTWVLNRGAVRLESLLDPGASFDLSIALLVMAPGADLTTAQGCFGVDEIFVHVVGGEIDVSSTDAKLRLAAGDSIHLAASSIDAIINTHSGPSSAYVITHPRMRL